MPTTNEAFIQNQMCTINQILGRPQSPFFLGEPCVGCLYWSDPVEQQRTLYEQQTGGAVAIETVHERDIFMFIQGIKYGIRFTKSSYLQNLIS